jgi:hypothetical protein
MLECVMDNEWIYAKESDCGLILSIVMTFAALLGKGINSSVGIVPLTAHIRIKHPPNKSQKLQYLKWCLAGCDLCTIVTIQVS